MISFFITLAKSMGSNREKDFDKIIKIRKISSYVSYGFFILSLVALTVLVLIDSDHNIPFWVYILIVSIAIVIGAICALIKALMSDKARALKKEIEVESKKTQEPIFEEPNIPEPTVFDKPIDNKKKLNIFTISIFILICVGVVFIVAGDLITSFGEILSANWAYDIVGMWSLDIGFFILFGCLLVCSIRAKKYRFSEESSSTEQDDSTENKNV